MAVWRRPAVAHTGARAATQVQVEKGGLPRAKQTDRAGVGLAADKDACAAAAADFDRSCPAVRTAAPGPECSHTSLWLPSESESRSIWSTLRHWTRRHDHPIYDTHGPIR